MISSSSRPIRSRLGRRDTSINVSISLRTPRSISRIKSVPPAIMRARDPRRARIWTTSAMLATLKYSRHMLPPLFNNLGHDADGDLLGRLGLDLEPHRRVDAGKLLLSHPSFSQHLHGRCPPSFLPN